ncbi:MAG: phage tail sheath C-terminal domain-containing protein [Candidatus Electrothrix communis]|nr:MAG: phage tail sheath C-terminal domain-containing protein [Candidatus Electrothrix communis]
MRRLPGLSLGAPGIYRFLESVPKTLNGAPMDVCAFVGVAPRGPAWVPEEPEGGAELATLLDPAMPKRRSVAVPVESWDEYRRLFGGFEGPGRLPYAVALFFEQGGRRAYVVRIVHEYEDSKENSSGVAAGDLPRARSSVGSLTLRARNEGSWGNRLRASLGFSASPVTLLPGTETAADDELVLDAEDILPVGSLLRLTLPATESEAAEQELCFVRAIRQKGEGNSGLISLRVSLDKHLPRTPATVELIEGIFQITDGTGMLEEWKNIGLSAAHPRWLAEVLYRESQLVFPDLSWANSSILPEKPELVPFPPSLQLERAVAIFSDPDKDDIEDPSVEDRYGDIAFVDFFDESWSLNDPDPGNGIQAVSHLADVSALVVPDLYVPEPLEEQADIRDFSLPVSSSFAPCLDVDCDQEKMAEKIPQLDKLRLDPLLPEELDTITALQKELVDFAEACSNFVVLLDVPPKLDQKKILQWRACFRSSYAAAYAPWLRTSRREDGRNRLVLLNPSAVAAGIIAAQEFRFGVPHGPANRIAEGVVKVDDTVSPTDHAMLHHKGINIFLQERDGVWLSAARTLSRDLGYRQLSVRRLMLMLRRTLQQEMQWAVFEPNSPALWREVRIMLSNYLRRLYAQGAFQGATEKEAFFVRCDAELNSQQDLDAGRLLCEVGVAPAEPLEFLVLRITRSGDGTLTAGE